jgi:hypothetical protein
MRHLVKVFIPFLDLILSPLVLVFSPAAYLVARLRGRAPLSRAILDKFEIGIIRHHYYEPLVFAGDTCEENPPKERRLPGIDLNEVGQLTLLQNFTYATELLAIPVQKSAVDCFGFYNGAFEHGDAEALYSIIRYFKPRRMIEVGCGQSTLMAGLAVAQNLRDDPAYRCEHVGIEPFEQPWLDRLGVRIIREKIECCPDEMFKSLESGDVLFIDSSHIIRRQGDVLHEILYLLPQISRGVLIHIHDIFLPRDYPSEWAIFDRRLWNEQYLLEAFLTLNKEFEVVCALNWLSHNRRKEMEVAFPMMAQRLDAEPASFWIRRK